MAFGEERTDLATAGGKMDAYGNDAALSSLGDLVTGPAHALQDQELVAGILQYSTQVGTGFELPGDVAGHGQSGCAGRRVVRVEWLVGLAPEGRPPELPCDAPEELGGVPDCLT